MKVLEVSDSAIDSMYRKSDPAKTLYPNPQGKPLSRLARDFHLLQFYPENHLNDVAEVLVRCFNKALQMGNLKNSSDFLVKKDGTSVIVSLFKMTSFVWARAGLDIFFGSELLEIEPKFDALYLEYDYLGWQVLFKYPKFLSLKMRAARTKLVDALENYFGLPVEERSDALWFTQTLEKEMRHVGVKGRDIAIMMLTIYWG